MYEIHILSIVLNDVLSWWLGLLRHLGFCVRFLGYAHKSSITRIAHDGTIRIKWLTLHGRLRELHLATLTEIRRAILVKHLIYTSIIVWGWHLEIQLFCEEYLLNRVRLLSVGCLEGVDLPLSGLVVLLLDQLVLLNLLHLLLEALQRMQVLNVLQVLEMLYLLSVVSYLLVFIHVVNLQLSFHVEFKCFDQVLVVDQSLLALLHLLPTVFVVRLFRRFLTWCA